MKKVLKAKQVSVNIKDYFDEEKKLYRPYPVFPFLSENDIKKGIEELIDIEILKEEIKSLYEQSKESKSSIENTSFIICLVKWHEYPELMKMLTVIREWAFRNDGGGVGFNDYDEFDLRPEMEQLIILNPDYEHIEGCIIGGYRYVVQNKERYPKGPMGAHYEYSEKWLNQKWIELGRSFINPYFQNKAKRHSINYVLHGLGFLYARYPETEGYFGKVTLYNVYEKTGADKFFLAAAQKYLTKTEDIWVNAAERIKEGILTESQAKLFEKGVFKGLFYVLRNEYHLNIPRIMAVYNRMTRIENILYFGGFRHNSFGNTTEVGIAIRSADLYEVIRDKFIKPYV